MSSNNVVQWFLPARRYANAGKNPVWKFSDFPASSVNISKTVADRNVSVCLYVCHAMALCQNEES